MKTVQTEYTTIPVDNISYLYKADGTSHTRPAVILKTGERIEIGYGDLSKLQKALDEEEPSNG